MSRASKASRKGARKRPSKPTAEPTVTMATRDAELLRELARSATSAILDGGDASVLLALRALRGIERTLGSRIADAAEVAK